MGKTGVALCLMLLSCAAYADLQNVVVGGEVRVRARYWRNVYENGINGPAADRIPPFLVPRRPLGPFNLQSRYDWDDRGNDLDFVEMRTRLNAAADMTDEVSAFIELESYDQWGQDFRSDYVTGADFAAATTNDVEIFQAYVQAEEMYGLPLRLRVGRQVIELGKGWLVDDIMTALFGQSHDAIRLTYDTELFSVDAWWSKLAETGAFEEDGDVDFYGVYGTYEGYEPLKVSLYWMLVRDARSLEDTPFPWYLEWIENAFGVDDYDPTEMHTVGLRAFGATGGFDYDLELAYQFGEADAVGARFRPVLYGDDGAEYDAWAGDAELGYTFDVAYSPRVYVGGAYFEGEDNRDLSVLEWINPFDLPEASVSFNRLFPGTPYSAILEIGQDMSNFYQVRAGVRAKPVEAVTASFQVAYYGVVEPFDLPRYVDVLGYRFLLWSDLGFWTQEADDEIGVVATLSAQYDYSEDLFIRAGWEHLFAGDGLEEGSFTHRYGLQFSGGTDDDDADYFYVDTGVKF